MKIKIVIAVALFNLFAVCNFVVAQLPAYVPSNGLVGWWPFTGNANDISGNGNNGTVNGATLTSDRFGNANQAYSFDGVNDYIQTNYSGVTGSNSRSISFWARTNGLNGSNNQNMNAFCYGNNSTGAVFEVALNHACEGLTLDIDNGVNTKSVTTCNNTWNNFVIVFDNSSGNNFNAVAYYCNGILLTTTCSQGNLTSINTSSINPVVFGSYWNHLIRFFQGQLDDIGIWNRALTQQEITNLYHANNAPQASITAANNSVCTGQSTTITATVANAGTSCNTAGLPPSLNNGLVGYWPFCGNAIDASGNGNNGTVNGATLINDRFSSANSAYSYNSNYILTNYLGISSNNPRSFSLWKNGTFGDLIAYGGSVDLPGCGDAFRIIDNNGTIEINTDCSSRSFQIPNYNQANWYHVVVVGGVSLDNFQVYVNGVICNLSNTQGTGVYNTSVDLPVNFGRCHRGNSYYSGKIDDIGMWNRALTPLEITQLYNAGQATYSWSPGGANTPSITVSPTQTTTYTCTITMNGATTTQTQTITVNPVPTVNAGQDQTVFAGTQVTLSGSGASSYAWNNGVINNTPFAATTTTTYTVTGTTNGCSATDQVLVTVLPAPSISATNDTICNGTSTTITATVANAGTSCVAPGLSGTLTNGLVGYWPFCGNANDLSGNGNNGTVNGATLTTDRFGVANQSYGFDGVNDDIRVNNNALFSFLLNSSFTSNVWFKIQTLPNETKFLISQGDGDAQHQNRLWGSYLTQNSVNNWFRGNNEPNQVFNTHPSLQVNAWKMVTMVRDFNSTIKMYIDGQLVDTDVDIAGMASPFTQIRDIYFGALYDAYNAQLTAFLNGQLDDIGIWNRALSAQEVSQLYNAGQATYLWSNGATTPSITVTPTQTTTYTCTITMNGATTTQSQTITVNALPTVSAGQNQAICAGSTLTLSGTGASTYTWNNNIQNGVPFTPISTQTYTVTGTTTSGCVNTAQVTVSVNPLPTVNAGQAQIVCAGTSVALSGSGASSYAWNNGVSNGVSFVPNNTQTYTVTGTDANGCTNTAQVTVTVNVPPAVSGGSPQTVCVGTPVTLNGSGASSYSWNNNVQNGVPFIPLSTQTYTLTGTAVNGCTNTAQVQVVVNALPAVSGGQNQSVCAGASLVLNGAGALTYTWNNNIQNGVSFIPNATQTYTVIGTNANGCQNSAQVQVTVNPLPTVGAGLPISVCSGTTNVVLYGSGAQTYVWSNGITNATAFTPVVTQNYTVTGTDMNGCANTAQVQVTVNALPTVSAGANQTVCAGTGVTLSGAGANYYVWSNGVTNATAFIPVATQNYTVTGTDMNGCANTAQVQVTVNALPTVSAGANQTVCAGTGVTLSGAGATSYVWSNGVTNATAFIPVATQNYTVTGTDMNGCFNTAQVQVTVNALPTVSAGGNQTVCAGTSVALYGSGASTYTWSNGITNAVSFTPVASQSYTVTGIDSNLCTNSDTILLIVNESTSAFLNQTACDFYTLNGQIYTQSGTYLQTLTNALGCDSTIHLDLTMNYSPTIPVVSVSNDVNFSTATQLNSSYQWILCSDNTNIPGAISNIYTATTNGLYGVIVSNTCGSDTSNCITIYNIGLNEITKSDIVIYPNPTFNFIKIIGLNTIGTDFEVSDGQGRILKTGYISSLNSTIDLVSFDVGIYWVNLKGLGVYELVKE